MRNGQQISDSELELMRIIWQKGGSAFFAEIMKVLEDQGSDWKQNTVLTFLVRLTEKGMLKPEKMNRKNNYVALVSEADYTETQTQTFLDKMYRGNAKNLISALLKQDTLSSEDFEELKQFWNEGRDIK